jgi:hypothetical protein
VDAGRYGLMLVKYTRENVLLGFFAKSCGISKNKLRNIGRPNHIQYENTNLLIKKNPQLIPWSDNSYIINVGFTKEATRINDNEEISEKMREYKLKRLFKKNGIELSFIN